MLLSKFKLLISALGVLLLTTACGFEPIYAYKELGYIKSELETVHIDPIPDRIGQELRNNLYDIMAPSGAPEQPLWNLDVSLSQSIQNISLERSSFSTRANLKVTASFILKNKDTDNPYFFTATTKAISSYNILDSDYANLIAKRDAQSRAVTSLSKDIARQLALWLRTLDE